MSNLTLFDGFDSVCNLYVEELTDDRLIENYFCRSCGHGRDEHLCK